MAKTIIVSGYGPGISRAVAEWFGGAGYRVALAARSSARLTDGVQALSARGVEAAAFPCDVGDPAQVRALVRDVQK